jgi:hypothetical protein
MTSQRVSPATIEPTKFTANSLGKTDRGFCDGPNNIATDRAPPDASAKSNHGNLHVSFEFGC